MTNENKPVEKLVRINSRITPKQFAYIKAKALKMGIGEGELHRYIISEFIKKHGK